MSSSKARQEEHALKDSVSSSRHSVGSESKSLITLDNAIPMRKALCTLGTAINAEVTTFRAMIKPPSADFAVYQYDVKMIREVELTKQQTEMARKVKDKIWNVPRVCSRLGQHAIYDGNNLAWSLERHHTIPHMRVDMTEESGRGVAKENSKNVFIVQMTFTNLINFSHLINMINGKATTGPAARGAAVWSEALTFLNHVIHQYPQKNLISVRNSVFPQNTGQATKLGQGVLAYRGVYAAFKAVFASFNGTTPIRSLSINVDATCVAFWDTKPLKILILDVLKFRDEAQFIDVFRQQAQGKSEKQWEVSGLFRQLKLLKSLKVYCYHLVDKARPENRRVFSIQKFLGVPPKVFHFEVKDSGHPEIPNGRISVDAYFHKKYPRNIVYNTLPCVNLGGDNVVPIECLGVVENQRYTHKLGSDQTNSMLKIAAQLPQFRRDAILNGVKSLNWQNDPWMNAFGIRTQNTMMKVQGRLLDCPTLEFRGRKEPNTKSGGWKITNCKFIRPNDIPIKSWGVFILANQRGPAVSEDAARSFMGSFKQIYSSHGGVFNCPKDPYIFISSIQNLGDKILQFVNNTKKYYNLGQNENPDILFFVLGDRSVDVYNVIKKSLDCRFGIASQCVQGGHVNKKIPQYISNVCMKVNAKLGGATCQARLPKTVHLTQQFYDPNERIMVIGADVTHGTAGGEQNSIASLAISKDHTLTRYMGHVEINGLRQDIIHQEQMDNIFGEGLKIWKKCNQGMNPKRILYFRDGVSREMCKKVLDQEVRQIKKTVGGNVPCTVIIATKRHHTRIFPEKGDQNDNPLPGTLVDTWATGAVDMDWYLTSHKAIKGTARPMHYNIILDENSYEIEALQQFIHEACFQYVRSTTSVSQFPAIYYAHLCARRGVIHEGKPISAQSDGKKEIDARRLAGMTEREAVLDYQQSKLRAQKNDKNMVIYMDPVPGILGQNMWYI